MALPGTHAPEIHLPGSDGMMHTLSEYAGTWVLLYFYPKDSTPGCTIEACSLRDVWDDLQKHNCTVLGVSTDSVASHTKFSDKHDLPFLLLADEDKVVVNAYGVWGKKKFMGKEYMGTSRTSFLINPEGKIAKVYENVKPLSHAVEVLRDLKMLQQ